MRVRMVVVPAALAVPAVLAGAVLGHAQGAAAQGGGRLQLSVSRAGLTEQAALGSNCIQAPAAGGGTTGGCADAGAPLHTHGRLPVRPGARVVLRPSVNASAVQAHLLQVSGSSFTQVGPRLRARRLGPHRWAVKLPADLRGARVLDVFLRWHNAHDGQGDADFWAAIREGCG